MAAVAWASSAKTRNACPLIFSPFCATTSMTRPYVKNSANNCALSSFLLTLSLRLFMYSVQFGDIELAIYQSGSERCEAKIHGLSEAMVVFFEFSVSPISRSRRRLPFSERSSPFTKISAYQLIKQFENRLCCI